MPAVETRCWDGATIDWSRYATEPTPIRCPSCRAVYPVDHDDAPTATGGWCRLCAEEKGEWDEEAL